MKRDEQTRIEHCVDYYMYGLDAHSLNDFPITTAGIAAED